MNTDEVTVANAALIHIGADPITDFAEDERKEAATAAARYGAVRDALLRAYRWNFAQRFAALPGRKLSSAQFGFTHEFELPAGRADDPLPYCLRVWEVDTARWKLRGRRIYTEKAGPLSVAYTARVVAVAEFDALFTEVLGMDLAIAISGSLGSSEMRKRKRELQLARRDLYRDAKLADAMEQSAEPLAPRGKKPSWIAARRPV